MVHVVIIKFSIIRGVPRKEMYVSNPSQLGLMLSIRLRVNSMVLRP